MTIDEVGTCYKIPLDILQEYESWGLCGAVNKALPGGQYRHDTVQCVGGGRLARLPGETSKRLQEDSYARLKYDTAAGQGDY